MSRVDSPDSGHLSHHRGRSQPQRPCTQPRGTVLCGAHTRVVRSGKLPVEVKSEHTPGSQSPWRQIRGLGLHRAHVLRTASCEQGAHDARLPTLASLVSSPRLSVGL